MDNGLIIFVRNPKLGKVKTRIAATLGESATLKVYEKLLEHTVEITKTVNADKFVYYSDRIDYKDIWNEELYFKRQQQPGDLGERMRTAFEQMLLKYKKVIIIGSDCLELTSQLIEDAFEILKTGDIVVGPARDGGYYLIGMKKVYPEIFSNKAWSTNTVLTETLRDIEQLGLTVVQLSVLSDVDEASDLPSTWLNS
jgi:rSAM/selenodomain-associated transferase 1